MRKNLTLLVILIGLIVTGYLIGQFWRTRYEVTELPVLPGYAESCGSYINNFGAVIVTCMKGTPNLGPLWVSYLWDKSIRSDPWPESFSIQGMNDKGQVVGGIGPEAISQAFVWDSTKQVRIIDIEGATRELALDINNNGIVLVFANTAERIEAPEWTMFGWDVHDWKESFRYPYPGEPFDVCLNENNDLFGSFPGREEKKHPMIVKPDGDIKEFDSFEMGLGKVACNNLGEILINQLKGPFGVIITNESVIEISGFVEDDPVGRVHDINDSRQVIGWSWTNLTIKFGKYPYADQGWKSDLTNLFLKWKPFALNTRAFLWENGTTYDLNDLIPSDSGWFLEEAHDINDKGEIVGMGYNPQGERRGFLLRPVGLGPTGSR